jgi:CelD/BcsL family acetyltransferase involved in cellulose biosynthesis
MKVVVHDHLEAVGEAAWDRLVAASRLRSPFLSWTWQREWARVFAENRRLAIHRVEDGSGRLVALLPLHESAPGTLQILGGADVSDYLDLIAVQGREEEAWMALLQARSAERVEWALHAVPAASPTVTAMAQLAAAYGLAVSVTVEERCPVLALPPSWEIYLASLSGKHRHELLRKTRRLEREAPDARVACVETPAEIEARLGDFFALHRRSRAGKARFMDDRMEGFFRRALLAFAARGACRLWFLDTQSHPIAAFVTIEWSDTVGLYNSGFDPERAALSPGVVLLAQLVRDAIARGRRTFDFLRGEERYKYEFEPVAEAVHAVRVR